MSQITVISGPERRRVWTDQQKRELVAGHPQEPVI